METMNLDVLTRPFDAGQIKQREGRGGKRLDYIETHAVITRLNEAFGGAWSFEVADYKTMEGEVVVQGRLTAGGQIKEQFGSAAVARSKDSGKPISIGDDLKSAASDALKKCATLFGVGLHLYDKGLAGTAAAPPEGRGMAPARSKPGMSTASRQQIRAGACPGANRGQNGRQTQQGEKEEYPF